ncbi:hypothetical protein C7477_103149 [Phyllobacterium leguminum]|uniref:RecT family protein n=2 Tax=Phyllobacterium leguminum TaxID=314237 RepID=A0A318T8K4_9HYPH|nr:hypothetical protein C7477_103149 [Phyllobacterium leguminum]
MVAIMQGMEVGLTPMAALQSIAVVNGRPTIWGDGAIGLVRGSGKLEWIKERIEGDGENMVAVCEVKRRAEPAQEPARFSVNDAKKAGLWGKQGPWQQYPKRMLAMRARAFALRDGFADVLRGLGIAEEVQDIQPIRDVTPPTPPKPPVPPANAIVHHSETITAESAIQQAEDMQIEREVSEDDDAAAQVDDTTFFERLEADLSVVTDIASLEEVWTAADPMARFEGKPNGETNQSISLAIRKRAEKRMGGA